MGTDLKALALVCSLKASPAASSSELIARQVLDELAGHRVAGDSVRVADHAVLPGVDDDMGPGDDWPAILDKIRAAVDYKDLEGTPKAVASTNATAAANAAHLARLLREARYPAA